MRLISVLLASCTMLAVPALAQESTGSSTASQGRDPNANQSIIVEMKNAEGASVGTVEMRQLAGGVSFVANLSNLTEGAHGFHIHATGICEGPSFESAGAHYNPTEAEHGLGSPQGKHVGDLPNIHVMQGRTTMAEFQSEMMTLQPSAQAASTSSTQNQFTLLDQDGSAVMIHENADDYQSNDSAGARIACGVIQAPQQ